MEIAKTSCVPDLTTMLSFIGDAMSLNAFIEEGRLIIEFFAGKQRTQCICEGLILINGKVKTVFTQYTRLHTATG